MANTLTRKKGGVTKQSTAAVPAAMPAIEFTGAAHEHTEPGGFDTGTITLSATAQPQGPFDVVAQGFIRHVAILVTTVTNGTLGPGVASADFPFNIFQDLFLGDVNGAQIFGPMDGYSAYVANVYGGYAFRQDVRLQADFSSAIINPAFLLRLPFEIQHNNGLGSLTNQNSAAAYKVRFTINTTTALFSTQPTTPPTIRVRGWLEAWTKPNQSDPSGQYPQAVVPPRHGTSQYWTKNTKTGLSVGDNTIPIVRLGNLIRCLAFVFRDGTGARSSVVPPDPLELRWDARQLLIEPQYLRRCYMSERTILSAAPDVGTFVFTFNHDVVGHAGDGTPELWIPTMQSTRLELRCVNIGAAGSCDILVNDVAPVEIDQSQRYAEPSASGFHPEHGASTSFMP